MVKWLVQSGQYLKGRVQQRAADRAGISLKFEADDSHCQPRDKVCVVCRKMSELPRKLCQDRLLRCLSAVVYHSSHGIDRWEKCHVDELLQLQQGGLEQLHDAKPSKKVLSNSSGSHTLSLKRKVPWKGAFLL